MTDVRRLLFGRGASQTPGLISGVPFRLVAEQMANSGFHAVSAYRTALVKFAEELGYSESDVEHYFTECSRISLCHAFKIDPGREDRKLPAWLQMFETGADPSKAASTIIRRDIEELKEAEIRSVGISDLTWKLEKSALPSVMDIASEHYGYYKIRNDTRLPFTGISKSVYRKAIGPNGSTVSVGYDAGGRPYISSLPIITYLKLNNHQAPVYLGFLYNFMPGMHQYTTFSYIKNSDSEVVEVISSINSATLGVFASFKALDIFSRHLTATEHV